MVSIEKRKKEIIKRAKSIKLPTGIHEVLNWEETVIYTMHQLQIKDTRFIKFMKAADHFNGKRVVSPKIYEYCHRVSLKLKNDYDHVTVVSGLEGSGKTTLAVQLAAITSPTFSMSHIAYEPADLVKTLKIVKPGDSIVLDEGLLFLFGRTAMKKSSTLMVQLLSIIRQINIHLIICVPNWFTIDTYIRLHRVNFLFHVAKRGDFKVITREGINIVNHVGAKYKNIDMVKLKTEWFFHDHFKKDFPNINDFNRKKYLELKEKNKNVFLEETEKLLMELQEAKG